MPGGERDWAPQIVLLQMAAVSRDEPDPTMPGPSYSGGREGMLSERLIC